MKKVIPALVVLLVVGACLPTIPSPASPTATAVTGISTTAAPASSDTPPPTETPVLHNPSITPPPASPTGNVTITPSPLPNLTSTLATSTDLPLNPSITPTQFTATAASNQPTLTPTLGILKFGTLPPEVPFNGITIWNRSKAQAYISLQVTLNDGRFSIIEYPVEGQVKVKAPLGSYVFVAWVGGNKMTGSFRLTSTDDLVIILYKDKVVIK
jgi:hypothetical protein